MCKSIGRLYLIASLAFAALLVLARPASAIERRVALVIGNASYQNIATLKNPVRDARLIADHLQKIGFETLYFVDVDGKKMRRAFRAYSEKLSAYGRDTIGLLFFAGHGIQVRENNYLLPTDADIKKESDAGLEAVHLADVLNAIFDAENKLNIVILDACRDNPYRKTMRTAGTGLAGFDAPVGTLISFSTGPGKLAYDGEGTNSPFAEALAAAFQDPALRVEDAFKRVSERVYGATARQQLPWFTTSVHGDFYLAQNPSVQVAVLPSPPSAAPPPVRRDMPRGETPPASAKAATEEPKAKVVASPTPRPVNQQAPPPPRQGSELEGRIAFFIEWKFFGSDNGARRLGPESYAETLDYYGKHAVPRDDVLKDKNKYYERWPNRRFALHRNTLEIVAIGTDSYSVKFDFKFDVENDTRQSVGLSTMSLGLRRANNDFIILSQDEIVRERGITDKTPTAAPTPVPKR